MTSNKFFAYCHLNFSPCMISSCSYSCSQAVWIEMLWCSGLREAHNTHMCHGGNLISVFNGAADS